jgi:hypothetical protein
MSTAEENFRTAVNKSTERTHREDAIDALIDSGACDKLAILVQMGGIDAPYRRQALNGLAEANCTDLLRTLAEDGSLTDSLRQDAEGLFQ